MSLTMKQTVGGPVASDQRLGLVERLAKPFAGRAEDDLTMPEGKTSIMDVQVSRRAVMGASASLAAIALPVAAPAVARPTNLPVSSKLEEMIADFEWIDTECGRLEEEYTAALIDFRRTNPLPVVHYGRRVSTIEETGEVIERTWQFKWRDQIEDWFDKNQAAQRCTQGEEGERRWSENRQKVLAEYDALRAAYEQAEEAAGFTERSRQCNAAADRWMELRHAIFSYRPADLREMDLKNRFVVRQLSKIDEHEWKDLAPIFEASSPDDAETLIDHAANIERAAGDIAVALAAIHGDKWRTMIDHQAGFVLVVRQN